MGKLAQSSGKRRNNSVGDHHRLRRERENSDAWLAGNDPAALAPDIDVDVASSKIFDVASDPDLSYGSGKKPKGSFPQGDLHLTVYSSPNDKALDASQIMFGSIMRLGQLNPRERDPNEVAKAPQDNGLADFIEYGGDGGFFGHAYFLSDPNVNADLVGLIRYGLKAGDPRRPIAEIKRPFWLLVSKQTASQ